MSKTSKKVKSIMVPPVCVWPTLIGVKVYTTTNSIKANMDCIPYEVSSRVNKMKAKNEAKKAEKNVGKSKEENKENKFAKATSEFVNKFKSKSKKEEAKKETTNEEPVEDFREVVEEEPVKREEPVKEEAKKETTTRVNEEPFTMHVEIQKENEPKVTLDFSNAEKAVIYDDPVTTPVYGENVQPNVETATTNDEDLKEVTQEDVDIALKKMRENGFKTKSKGKGRE